MYDLKIFTDIIEPKALDQVYTLAKQPAFDDAKIRIMPDVHAGAGCVIGFTADLGEKVIPNLVGVDIGCGMLTVNLGKIDIDFPKLDEIIRKYVPSGRNVHSDITTLFNLEKLYCYKYLHDTVRIVSSIGTLGGGNHFIEIDADEDDNKYLIIHTGSRNLGLQVAKIYQNLAIEQLGSHTEFLKQQKELIKKLKEEGRSKDIQSEIEKFHKEYNPNPRKVPRELSYLTGEDRKKYLHDMKLCQEFAILNRQKIAKTIISKMKWTPIDHFETIHNYIEFESNIVRKGAVSAKKGERLLIPINMRDGCIIGIGKGNPDWNYSAPHGAGRILSRSAAKESILLEDFKEAMKGIYTTSVCQGTIDESPMAYKSIDDIVNNIADSVEIIKIIKPLYNFKANEDE